MPRLAADEDAAHRAQRADAHGRIASLDLDRRGVGQIGSVAFAGMDDENAGAPRGGQDVSARSHSALEARNIVAEGSAEASRLQEIPLHIDNDQRHPADIDGERLRLRRYGPDWQGGLHMLVRSGVSPAPDEQDRGHLCPRPKRTRTAR